MTVAELIEKLSEADPTLPVLIPEMSCMGQMTSLRSVDIYPHSVELDY